AGDGKGDDDAHSPGCAFGSRSFALLRGIGHGHRVAYPFVQLTERPGVEGDLVRRPGARPWMMEAGGPSLTNASSRRSSTRTPAKNVPFQVSATSSRGSARAMSSKLRGSAPTAASQE